LADVCHPLGISGHAADADWLPEAGGLAAGRLTDTLSGALWLRVINLCS